MAHDRDADRFALDRARVIDPLGGQAPGVSFGLAFAVHDSAALSWRRRASMSATRTANVPSFVSPNVTSPSVALIVIVKSIQRLSSGRVPKTSVRSSSQMRLSPFIQSLRVTIVAVSPLAFDFDELAMGDVRPAVALVVVDVRLPEIDAVHLVVREPQRLMMRMVVCPILLRRPERIRPRHRLAGRPNHRPHRGRVARLREILGKQLAVDFDDDAALAPLGRDFSTYATADNQEYHRTKNCSEYRRASIRFMIGSVSRS